MPTSSYQLLKDTYAAVSSLEAKMDERMCKIEDRVGAIEGFMNKVLGIVAIIGAISGVCVTWAWNKITGKA